MATAREKNRPTNAGTLPGREKLLMLAILTGLSLVMTWPLARHLGSSLNDHGDPLLNSWILWWVVKALTTAGVSLFNAPIFYPEPLTLAYSEHLLVSALTVSPVLLAGGDALLAHNVMFLVSIIVAGWGAYLLGYELTGSRGAAWVAALAFAFNPYRFGHLGHLQMQTDHFMPLVLLYLHRWVKDPRWSPALAFGFFWLLQILSCGYYALFISLAVAVFLLYHGLLGRWWREGRRLGQMAAVGLGVALMVLPLFLPYITVKKEMGFKRDESLAAIYSAHPGYYLVAPPANVLYGGGHAMPRAAEGELFLGLGLTALVLAGCARPASPSLRAGPTRRASLVALSLGTGATLIGSMAFLGSWNLDPWLLLGPGLACLLAWRVLGLGGMAGLRREGPARFFGWRPEAPGPGRWAYLNRDHGYYLLLALVAFWASLGPQWGLYALLYQLVPGFDTLRVPSRLAVVVTLAWAVLAAFGWAKLEKLCPDRPRVRQAGLALACGLILLEACSLPIPWTRLGNETTPEVYQWLARQPKGSVVMEFPALGFMDDQARDARYLYWSTKHGQTLVNGYSGYFPASYLELAKLAQRLGKGDLLERLSRRGARFIIVHTKEYSPSDRGWLINKLAREPGLRLVYNDHWNYAYELTPTSPGR